MDFETVSVHVTSSSRFRSDSKILNDIPSQPCGCIDDTHALLFDFHDIIQFSSEVKYTHGYQSVKYFNLLFTL